MASIPPEPNSLETQSHKQAAQERLYNLVQQKDRALAEYRQRVELSRSTDGYFDPHHLEAEEWLDVAHSKWKQVEALQKQYEQHGIKLIPLKPLTRLEQHQQQTQFNTKHPPGNKCNAVPLVQSNTRPSEAFSTAHHRPATAACATGKGRKGAPQILSTGISTAETSSLLPTQNQATGGALTTSAATATTNSCNSIPLTATSSSRQQTQQVNWPPGTPPPPPVAEAIASSISLHPLSAVSSKTLIRSCKSVTTGSEAVASCIGSWSSSRGLVESNRLPFCRLGLNTSAHNNMASSSIPRSRLPTCSNQPCTNSRMTCVHADSPWSMDQNAAAAAPSPSHETNIILQESSAAACSSTDQQTAARAALLQHLCLQQTLWEAESARAHSTSISAALQELLLQPILKFPKQMRAHTKDGPGILRSMLQNPQDALKQEVQLQKARHNLERFRDSSARMGATQAERAKQLYSKLMYSLPEDGQQGLWDQLCGLFSKQRKERQFEAEQYIIADDLDVMFMHKTVQGRQSSGLRGLWQRLCKQIPYRSMWYAIVLLWSTAFNTWLLLDAKAYSWRHRRRMAWLGYPSIIGQTRGNGALRQYYQNLDQRFVDDEPGHLGLSGLVKAGILPYLESWTPVAIACRLQSAVAADYKWQHKVWQLEHPGVPFVYLETPVSQPGGVWATEALDVHAPTEEGDIQLAALVAEHGNTFSKRQLSTALAICRGVEVAQFDFPRPTLLQLAQTHANSKGSAAAKISRQLLDAEEEQYVSEILDKQERIHAFHEEEWKVWRLAVIASVPVLAGTKHHMAVAGRFNATQQTRHMLQEQREELVDVSERLMQSKCASNPFRVLMHHLALHYTGGVNPSAWHAMQQRKPRWHCWLNAAGGKLTAAFGHRSSSSSSCSSGNFPAANDAVKTAALELSKHVAQQEKVKPYSLGPKSTVLGESQQKSKAADCWWIAADALKQRMKHKQDTTSTGACTDQVQAAANDQVPIMSAAALAAAKLTMQEANTSVAECAVVDAAAIANSSAAADRAAQACSSTAAACASPLKHAYGPSRLCPSSTAVAVSPYCYSDTAVGSTQVAVHSDASAEAQQLAWTAPHGDNGLTPISFENKPNHACPLSQAAVAAAESASMVCSSDASQHGAASTSREASSTRMCHTLGAAAAANLCEQNNSVTRAQASISGAAGHTAAGTPGKTGSVSAAQGLNSNNSSTTAAGSRCFLGSGSASVLADGGFIVRQGDLNKFTAAAAAGVQIKGGSFDFSAEGKAAGKRAGCTHARKPDGKEANFSKPSDRDAGLGLVDILCSRKASFSEMYDKVGSREGSFSGLAGRQASSTSKGAYRAAMSHQTSMAGMEESADFEVDCSAASDASMRNEGTVDAE